MGEDLQFDKVEPEAAGPAPLTCKGCNAPISDRYWQQQGLVICDRCRAARAAVLEGSGAGRFVRAAFYGGVAAAIGAGLYYAVLALTGYEIGFVSIIVGIIVGLAVKKGSGGVGGWAYQSLAIGLTYLSITITYVPMIFEELTKDGGGGPGANVAATATGTITADGPAIAGTTSIAATPPTAADPAPGGLVGTALGMFVGLIALVLVAMAAPILAGLDNLLGILIIGFGLYEAWKINKRADTTILGPFQVTTPPA